MKQQQTAVDTLESEAQSQVSLGVKGAQCDNVTLLMIIFSELSSGFS